MKYKNEREAQVGDHVVGLDSKGNPVSGVVAEVVKAKKDARLTIHPLRLVAHASASECLHVEDVLAKKK